MILAVSVTDAERCGLPHVDLTAILGAADPVAELSALRRHGWVVESDLGYHVLTYDQCFSALRDSRFHQGVPQLLRDAGIGPGPMRDHWLGGLLGSAPRDHDRMRRLMAPWFTQRSLRALSGYVSLLTERLAAAGGRQVEVMSEVAEPIPPAFFCRMIGAPEGDASWIGARSNSILRIFNRDPSEAGSIQASFEELRAYVGQLIEDRRRRPRGDDMISALLDAEEGGSRLTSHELSALVIEALEASTDNTSNQLGLVLSVAAARPDSWDAVRGDPSLVTPLVEEASRLRPRIVHATRVCDDDLELDGLAVPAGTVLFLAVPSAHRDPVAFPEPDRLDLRRQSPRANLNFGSGAHFCIGAALARLQMTEAVGVLARRWRRISLAEAAQITYTVGVTVVNRLVVDVEPGM